ncbi:aspartic proteinase CDR1-like [Prosopis cineraria]|uniref:aspartic proteinase CDR1-like n=1 Tax=Prosopis cineraria TaxID=364024 RepID=UPI00241015D1|nr:aspartic proteinase CDR1-like [Prosopis cineraria]
MTGSDFTWLQCMPCIRCFDQGDLDYLHTDFNWGLHAVDCRSIQCIHIVNPSVTEVFCEAGDCQCKYMIEYSDDSTSAGDVFQTLLRLQTSAGDYVLFPSFIFGCSRETRGDFSAVSSGIVGLGRAPASMVSQLYNYIDGKFAYCLVPLGQDVVSEMRFGPIAVVSGPDVIYTPMIATYPTSYNYHILMEGITVGDVYVPYLSGNTIANTIIDCGTTVTRLPPRLYSFLEEQVARQLDRLYRRGDEAILGTLLQANFMVSYDLQRRQIAFKKMNCANLD